MNTNFERRDNLTLSTNNRKDILKAHFEEELCKVLEHAEREDSLDYFKIEITNHNGSVQMDYFFRERSKVY